MVPQLLILSKNDQKERILIVILQELKMIVNHAYKVFIEIKDIH